ncbi:hypothetical protein D3C72_1314000 [compost metagenome]
MLFDASALACRVLEAYLPIFYRQEVGSMRFLTCSKLATPGIASAAIEITIEQNS